MLSGYKRREFGLKTRTRTQSQFLGHLELFMALRCNVLAIGTLIWPVYGAFNFEISK